MKTLHDQLFGSELVNIQEVNAFQLNDHQDIATQAMLLSFINDSKEALKYDDEHINAYQLE